ncbi:MAG: chemotaxis protein CheC [Firmicutes bacterium]|jgi:chemotaxis protein CheC|nr:chemotaxis protein CheC [Bacillota bacterium]
MAQIPRISETRLDFLKELANIGVGNAATSLSEMLNNEKISMEVPEVVVIPLQDITAFIEEEQPVAAIFFEARSEDFKLMIILILPEKSAQVLVRKVLPTPSEKMGEMERSALTEIGNIVNSAYLNALSALTGITIMPSPPNMALDMGGAILGTILAETFMVEDYLILSVTSISTEKDDITGNVIVFPYQGSMERIFNIMGV